MMDAMLPMNLIRLSRSLYIPTSCRAEEDPCLSPLVTILTLLSSFCKYIQLYLLPDRPHIPAAQVAGPELLARFPPTSVMVGGFDPFLDDAVDFVHALSRAGNKTCRLKVWPRLPHCFLNFCLLLTEARAAAATAADWMKADLYSRG
jgi:acetyl esterase/lipase